MAGPFRSGDGRPPPSPPPREKALIQVSRRPIPPPSANPLPLAGEGRVGVHPPLRRTCPRHRTLPARERRLLDHHIVEVLDEPRRRQREEPFGVAGLAVGVGHLLLSAAVVGVVDRKSVV